MAVPMGALGNVADPRSDSFAANTIGSYPNRVLKTLHNPAVQFEEYLFYAKQSRAEENAMYGPGSNYADTTKGFSVKKFVPGMQAGLTAPGRAPRVTTQSAAPQYYSTSDEKHADGHALATDDPTSSPIGAANVITDEEWLTASRAARTATWGAVFYLITTDILGPFGVPWAMSQLGWGPGTVLFTIFGALAGYSGWQLWHMFIALDSDRYPLKNYGDLAFRIYGKWFRYICNVLQSFQFFFNVGLLILSSGMGISQLSYGPNGTTPHLCFIVCSLVFMIAGLLVGQIRTLARLGWLANISVWLNLFIIFATMALVANSLPNYSASFASYPNLFPNGYSAGDGAAGANPVITTAGTPGYLGFQDNINGLMQAVFSYGRATLFCELMSEMRRPWDFWKGLLAADLLIFCAYLLFGLFVYGYQGQYAFNPAFQGINPYSWQTVCNVFNLISGLIAAVLYGNIGIKVLYANVGRDLLKFPPLESTKGKWIWVGIVPLYWVCGFIVGSAIPQFSVFSSFVGAAFILQFTYTFPPFLLIGFKCQRDAMLPEETFDPQTGRVSRVDSGFGRWMRGFKKDLFVNIWDCVYCLGSAATAVLGIYAAIYSMHAAYTTNKNLSAFSCSSPIG